MKILRILLVLLLIAGSCFAGTQKVSLRLQWKHQFEFAGFYAAKDQGYYRDAGLDVDILEYENGVDILSEVTSGKVDFGIWGSSIIEKGMQGMPVVLLANYFKRSPLVLVTQPDIRLPSELSGKTLMISDFDIKNANYTQMFRTFKIDMSKINRVAPTFNMQDFIDKKVDGVSIFLTNEPFLLQKSGIPYNIIDPNNYGVELYDVNLFTSKQLVETNPALADAFTIASNRGWVYALEHPEEIVDLILEQYNTQHKSREHLLFEARQTVRIIQPKTYRVGSIDRKQIDRIATLFTEVGLANPNASYSFIFSASDSPAGIPFMHQTEHAELKLTPEEQRYLQRHPEATIAMMPDFAPFSYMVNDDIIGFEHDLLALLTDKTGLTFVPRLRIWNEGLSAFKSKKIDMISSISYQKERAAFTLFTEPYYKIPIMIFVRDDFGKYKGLESLTGKKVGILKDVFYTKDLEMLETMDLVGYETYAELTKALVFGHIDALVQSLTNISYLIKKHAYTNLRLAGELELPSITKEDLRFGIRSDNPLLQSIIQKGMDDITVEERMALENKWLGTKNTTRNDTVRFTRSEREYLAKKGSIRMCVDPDWMPLEGLDQNLNHIGITADILKEVMRNSGLVLQLVPTKSWQESVDFAKKRQCDIFSLAMQTPERLEYMNFTRPYVSFPFVIATLSKEFFIENLKSLSGKKLAMLAGYATVEIIADDYPDIDIVEVNSLLDGIQMVRSGEVYGYVDALPPLASAIQKEGMTDIRITGKFDIEYALSVATRNDEPLLRDIMQKALDSVDSETIQAIYNRWLAIHYDARVDYSLLYKVIAGFVVLALLGYWRHVELRRINKTIEKQNRQLQEAYEKYSWLAENMDDVVWVMDVHGKFIYVSPSVEKLRGYTPEEVMAQRFEDAICEGSPRRVKDGMAAGLAAVQRGETPSLELIRVEQPCRDGSTVWTEINARLVVDEDNDEMRFIGLTRNITETLAYEKELEKLALNDRLSKEKAEAANRAKSIFLANMSHEIRTPMNAVIGFSDLLSSFITDEQQKNYLEAIRNAGKSLLTLINDILDLSKIEAGKLSIQYEPVSPAAIVKEISQVFQLAVSQKKLDFIVDVDERLPPFLELDETRLRQVLFNLIGNAVKFTDAGMIRLTVKHMGNSPDPEKIDLMISVEDTGIGVRPEQQRTIFDAFKQQDGQSTRKYGGTGLGLAITKRLVEMMKGRITLESQPGRGSRFEITLMDVRVASKKMPPDPFPEPLGVGADRFEFATVLVVDDVQSNRDLIRETLLRCGLEILEAVNGAQALHLVEETDPALILMDIRMPVMDGYETTRKIRENPDTADIPIIALTASVSARSKETMMEKGFDDFLAKPIVMDDLMTVLSNFLTVETKALPVAENQVKTVPGTTFQPKEITNIPELVTILERDILSQLTDFKKAMEIDKVEHVVWQLRELSQRHHYRELKEYANHLNEAVMSLDFDQIEHLLDRFPNLYNQLKEEQGNSET